MHLSVIKRHKETQALTNNIINHSHTETWAFPEPLNPSLSWSARRMSPLFNDTEGGNGFSLFTYNSITFCMGVLYCTELTRLHHLVIFDSVFLALIWSSHSLLYNTLLCDCIKEGSDFLDRHFVFNIQVHVLIQSPKSSANTCWLLLGLPSSPFRCY